MHFSADLEAKNDKKIIFFLVGVFDAVLFVSYPATLDFADRRSTLEDFQNL